MAEAFLQVVLGKLDSMIQKEFGLLWGVEKEMQNLSSTLSTVQAVLEDAEEKQVRDKAIQNWLRKLKDATYDADDILDEFATEASRWKLQDHQVCSSFMTCFDPKNIVFRHEIAKRMQDVVRRLDQIAEERMKFHLREITFADRQVEVIEMRQTGSISAQPVVYGREEDHEKIVQYLLNDAMTLDGVSIYPIVGIGGLGKTTIAQLVFNDERAKNHFELRIWVCVSQDFHVKRVIKAIIESASGTACEDLDLDPLQRRLQEVLNRKRYLIVLDDVWNDDQEKWDRLKHVVACGSEGACIIVTTRLGKVASVVGTVPALYLAGLSPDDCWSLFKERAFGYETAPERPNLIPIGKEIVKKCGGVPLAVKALGSLMRFKREEIQWLHVKESELWNLPQYENSILPSLRLSYFNLPLRLRQCFAYCAVFPKDYEIDKETLVHLWMANGFISSDGVLRVEDIGNEICNELYLRSLFQVIEKDGPLGNILKFKLHDLVHDLAQSVIGEECHILEPSVSTHLSRRIRHVTLPYSKWSFTIPNDVYKIESLRTLQLQKIYPFSRDKVLFKFSCDFSKLPSLRAFVASGSRLTKLSSSVSCMKHLRYFDLSSTNIRTLPESICSLWNLQILKLVNCYALQRLPNHIRLLANLRHLCIEGCRSLSYFPPKIGELTNLQTLRLFIVGRKRGCDLSELKRLDLKGQLCIKHLERVGNPMEAREANLSGKEDLHFLLLSWDFSTDPEHAEKVLESLEPHPNIRMLGIKEYEGINFPHWMSGAVLNNVDSFNLSGCKNCVKLPALSKLPSLTNLGLTRINNVQYLHEKEWDGTGFLSLKFLFIDDLPMLIRLTRDGTAELFQHLIQLRIVNCPKLTLPCLVSLKELSIWGCNKAIFNSISNLSSLNSLYISDNDEVTSFPEAMLQNLTALQFLSLRNITKLKDFPGYLLGLNSLKTLCIEGCHELESIPAQGLRDLSSLESLEIDDCSKFRPFSEGFQYLTSLQSLIMRKCPQLPALPDGIKYLVSLKNLSILGNPSLTSLPKSLGNLTSLYSLRIEDCPNLASLPHSFGNLTSLHSLRIENCPNLTSLPSSIKNLTNLHYMIVINCHELVKRCKKRREEDWHKILHIPYVYLDGNRQL